jgi:hypothetical protein
MLAVEMLSVLLIKIIDESASIVDRRDQVVLLAIESPHTNLSVRVVCMLR